MSRRRFGLLRLCCLMGLLTGCRGNSEAASVVREGSQTLATRAALAGEWQLRGDDVPGRAAMPGASLTFKADGSYTLTSGTTGAPPQSGSFRFASGYLILESPGCDWPPADLSGLCTGIYALEVVRRNGSPDVMRLRLVKDKENAARGLQLDGAVLVATAP